MVEAKDKVLEKFTLPAAVLRAAMCCQAEHDVRYYLNGFHVNSERVAANDGHRLFVCYSETWSDPFKNKFPDKGLIISLEGSVPKRGYYADFTFYSDDMGICEFRKSNKKFIRRCTFSIIDGKFPDINKVVPKGERKSVTNIGFNGNYLADIGKISRCMDRKWETARLDFYGEGAVACCSNHNSEFGKNQYIVMPIRL